MLTSSKERKLNRDAEREAARRLKIEWADKLWLAQNHPCSDEILVWLAEHRAEASKIGSSRWNLETLPELHAKQQQLRQAAAFQEVLDRAKVSLVPANASMQPIELPAADVQIRGVLRGLLRSY